MEHVEGGGFVNAGWLRVIPAPALYAYSYIGANAWGSDSPTPGDLDDLDLGADQYGGLDVPLSRFAITEGEEDEDDVAWGDRWELWRRCADERGCRLETYRDVIEFMATIGLVERHLEDGTVGWRPAMPAPLAEDVLPLDEEERQVQTQLRWDSAFRHSQNRIINWLVAQRGEGADVLLIETSIGALAETLELDINDARHGLACALDCDDISAIPDPEKAQPNGLLKISVDWSRFDEDRMQIRFGSPEE